MFAPCSPLVALLCLVICLAPAAATAQTADVLGRAQTLLDGGDAAAALKVLEGEKGKPNAEGLLLRSTAQIMLGDTAAGYRDLERALKADPGLRQGWLNLAGLEIAEGRYDAAYDALLAARDLDPEADDNDLNLGAVLILRGDKVDAGRHFATFLERRAGSAEAAYLVASNYALGGHEEEAVAHLAKAIELDERLRLRARSDDRFLTLDGAGYRRLLNTDSWRPPPGFHTVAAAFRIPYQRNDPRLVYAVLDALKELGQVYDPNIEATDTWALIWGEVRIKVYNQGDGSGVVGLSAPAERFADDAWHRRTQVLFRSIHTQLERTERSLARRLPPP